MPRILCISLSPIERDARVLRQIRVLAEFGEVTTVGYGEQPPWSTEHIEVPRELSSLPRTALGVLMLATRQLRRASLAAPAVRFSLNALRGRRFDLVVANDARVLALAHRLADGAPVWADLHEWAPEERTHVLSWRLLVAPLMVYLCRTFLPLSAATSTVCESIADLYKTEFDVRPAIVRNSNPWQQIAPTAVSERAVRLVHSGAAVHGRSLETMIEAVQRLDERFSLDLYLVPGGDGGEYYRALERLAADCSRIRFCDPVAPAALPSTLNSYDAGVFVIPPTHTNARLTLPNKFFDYVQARLAIVVGPTVEMQRLVDKHKLGLVTAGFTVDDIIRSLSQLTAESLRAFKAASDGAARELSFETDAGIVRELIAPLLTDIERIP